jgi:hypothetical protein
MRNYDLLDIGVAWGDKECMQNFGVCKLFQLWFSYDSNRPRNYLIR